MKFRWHLLFVLIIYLALVFLPKNFPPGFNADEAAFGYNSYTLSQTAKDEYGVFLPLRLKSFGDYKLPLYSYLSIPFIKAFGLNEFGTRFLAKVVGFFLIIAIYWFTWELFGRQKIALMAALFASVSTWIHIFAHQAHETPLAALFIALSLASLLRFRRIKKYSALGWSFLFAVLSLYSYHSAKILFPVLILLQFYFGYSIDKFKFRLDKKTLLITFISAVLLFSFILTEIKTPAARVKNLFLFSHPGISLITSEAKIEERFSPFGQSFFVAGREFVNRHLSYFSPEFLVIRGDHNVRFGFQNLSPLTYIEYFAFLVGIVYLIKNKHPYRYLLSLLLVTIPLAGSLSWQEYSLSRTFALILVILPLSAYGLNCLLSRQEKWLSLALSFSFGLSLSSLFFLFIHYPMRGINIVNWQGGYRQLADLIKTNYNDFDRFYITKKHGQPYIMLLFYLKYPPEKYQNQAKLSPPDEYGFGQIEGFDKFNFNFKTPDPTENASYIGFPDDFPDANGLDTRQLRDITVGSQTIFRIYENRLN